MSEWFSYSLTDFLLFSPRTYYRLFELTNAAIWPAQIAALALGLVILVLSRRPSAAAGRIVSGLLASGWLWVAWAFFVERYATINWAATYFAAAFAVEAGLLAWTGATAGRLRFGRGRDAATIVGTGLFLFALAIQPLLGPLLGRDWRAAELFGVAPDPTVTATLGILLLAKGRPQFGLLAVPVLWCALSGATLWAMEAGDFWVLPLAAMLTLAAAAWQALRPAAPAEAGLAP